MNDMPRSWSGGRYEATAVLGAGGMGRVYEVRVTATGGRAALKELSPSLAKSEVQLERFRREATAMGALEHPHLARCFDFAIDDDGSAYLVMELLEGRSLSQIVKEDGPLDGPRAARLGAQVASALSAAHAEGIIHRDVKPSNVVVVEGYDGKEVAKLVDFGVASIKESPAYQKLTSTGQVIGTPNYMAPEQLTGSGIDERTDVYALGALLYGVLAARHPYPGATLAEVVTPLLAGDRPPLPVLRPELGPLAQIVERAMALEPGERFASAKELGDALARLSLPPSAPQPARPPVVTKRDQPSPVPSAPAPKLAPDAEPPQDRKPTLLVVAAVIGVGLGAFAVWNVVGETAGVEPIAPRPLDVAPVVPVAERTPDAAASADAQVDAPAADGPERDRASMATAMRTRATPTGMDAPETDAVPVDPNALTVTVRAEPHDHEGDFGLIRELVSRGDDAFLRCWAAAGLAEARLVIETRIERSRTYAIFSQRRYADGTSAESAVMVSPSTSQDGQRCLEGLMRANITGPEAEFNGSLTLIIARAP